jgi:hypothetical protein
MKTACKNERVRPGTPAEYKAFSDVLRKVLTVSHSELQSRIEVDKKSRQEKRRKPTKTSADREARVKD